MSHSNERLQFKYIAGAATTAGLIMSAPIIEAAQPIGSPEVAAALDTVANYTPNIAAGVVLANFAAIGYTAYRNRQEANGSGLARRDLGSVPDKQLWRDRYKLTAIVVGAAALSNAVIEARWGIQALPGEWTADTAPTINEMIAGSAAGALVANAFWSRKRRHAGRAESRHRSAPSHVA